MFSVYVQGMFPPGQGATIGVDFMIKTIEIDNEKVKVIYQSIPYSYGLNTLITTII